MPPHQRIQILQDVLMMLNHPEIRIDLCYVVLDICLHNIEIFGCIWSISHIIDGLILYHYLPNLPSFTACLIA